MSLNNILLISIVLVVVLWIMSTKENFDNTIHPHIGESPKIPEIPTIPSSQKTNCPIQKSDLQTEYYIRKNLINPSFCPRPVKSIKQFNKDFFDFRDKFTNENSSNRPDSVDKVLNLYLSGDLGQAREMGQNMKIKDLFDHVTDCGPNLYERQCVRLPDFDNTMHDDYNANIVTGMSTTRDNWEYPGERPINGGSLEYGIYPHDQEYLRQMPALQNLK
ncbi:hypothetical protein Indivirus_3_9 [Indivirus ILV1]|uniref:Uncharacterized protein n=1 Tax=Indivirus ILV1 TaxID=1977633 RepID=A0A1V0SDF9_9VIRU|nr:hypothetical protein Indivirus_3_9 [Indivirus ILV1]